jgi:hypothetical protein
MPKPSSNRIVIRNVVPDAVDFRDRLYRPRIAPAPPAVLAAPPPGARPVLHQGDSAACTGFALASLIHVLTARRDHRTITKGGEVSPYMLYCMARHYDHIEGNHAANGSSLRGVLKGWHKHGAAARTAWPEFKEPKRGKSAATDWWDDAVQRPLGAYYRVDHRNVVDMQIALSETGALLAAAHTHAGWDAGWDARTNAKSKPGAQPARWILPWAPDARREGGHAFVIVGYDATGFTVQNSWGSGWGDAGLAVLSYADWLANGYDCWAAQLGVVTQWHRQAAAGRPVFGAVRTGRGGQGELLDNHALSPYVVNTGNDGALSASGRFFTTASDIAELVGLRMPAQKKAWGLAPGEAMDVALYAHGGLVGEGDAEKTAATWIPLLLEARIFPVFFMWESGLMATLLNEIKDAFGAQDEIPTAGFWKRADRYLADRIEGLARSLGRGRWAEMKENARLVAENPQGGGALLANHLQRTRMKMRLHLIGHSAGAILHAAMALRLAADQRPIESLTLMAPAARVDLFHQAYAPLLRSGRIGRALQFHLSDAIEDDEGEMRAVLGYKRSLLYMIANGLEEHRGVPVLGMQKYFERDIQPLGLPNLQVRVAPNGTSSGARTHGGFDDDTLTQQGVIAHLKGQAVP